jgi:small conductance mechanosensitive channel
MINFTNDLKLEVFNYYDKLVSITPKLLVAIIVLLFAWFLARQIRRISERKLKRNMEDPLLADFLATLLRFTVFVIGLLVALKIIGFGGVTSSILAGAGISAFVIGFALRDIGENFLAGILMAFKRPFRVGDFVETGSIKGKIVGLNIRDTQIKTPDGKDVYVPNAMIIKNPLINYTIDGFLRFDFVIELPGDTDFNKAIKIIEDAVNTVEGVIRKRRKTTANITGISPGRLNITVSFWIDTFRVKDTQEKIRSEVILAVQQALQKTSEAEKA